MGIAEISKGVRAFGVALIVALVAGCADQPAAPLKVVSSNGVRVVLEELTAELEEAVGVPIELELSTARTLTARLLDGEPFDVAILTPPLIGDLVAAGLVDPATPIEFARVGIGVGARAGAQTPGVATADALRRTLLAAQSIAFGENGQSRETNEAAFEALGIVEEVRDRARLTGPGEAPGLVADGEVDIVLTLVSELVREPGVEFLGPFPAELQGYITFAAAMGGATAQPDAARAFLDSLSSPAFVAALERSGLESVTP